MFKIKFLPARFGDSIWIEYGDRRSPHRILIDGGTAGTRHAILDEIKKIPASQRTLDLLVISHIDRDHLEGILGLLSMDDPGFKVNDLWFNGWSHLPVEIEDDGDSFGALQGEKLSAQILRLGWPWNETFNHGAVFVPENDPLPQIDLPGGMRITLLSPTLNALAELRPKWSDEVRAANLVPGFGLAPNDDIPEEEVPFDLKLPDVDALANSDYEPDRSEANASSIAFLAEFDGKRALLTADAHAETLLATLNRLSPDEKVQVDLYKISHHGSKFTTHREVLEKVTCPRYVISTNSSIFRHPDEETLARVLTTASGPTRLIFNYQSEQTKIWNSSLLKKKFRFRTTYPRAGREGIVVYL